jgi:hypothetical protein
MSQIRTVGAERDIGRRKRRFLYGGTDGSNPVPSSRESVSRPHPKIGSRELSFGQWNIEEFFAQELKKLEQIEQKRRHDADLVSANVPVAPSGT